MIRAAFHVFGVHNVVSDKLSNWVRYILPFVPMCLRSVADMLSGPTAFDFLDLIGIFY